MTIEEQINNAVASAIQAHMKPVKELVSQVVILTEVNTQLKTIADKIYLKTYSITEAAELTSLSKKQLQKLILDKQISSFTVGNKYYITHSTLINLLNP